MPSHPVFYILPLFVPLLQVYICFAVPLVEVRFLAASTRQGDKRCEHQFPTQKPECPACQKAESPDPITEIPPVIEHHLGRPKCVDTSNHYCPNSEISSPMGIPMVGDGVSCSALCVISISWKLQELSSMEVIHQQIPYGRP